MWSKFQNNVDCSSTISSHRKLFIQEMNLTHFTGSEEEQFTMIMTPTKEEDFESLGQYIL